MNDQEDLIPLTIEEMEVYEQTLSRGNRCITLARGSEVVRGEVILVLTRSSSVLANVEGGEVEEITLSRMATRH